MLNFSGEVIKKLGPPDLLVNNAGIALIQTPFHQVNMEDFDRLMSINFEGGVNGCHAFLPHLLQRPEAALVDIGSALSFMGLMDNTAYVAAKFAVYGFTQCLIPETKGSSVSVHRAHPTGVKTNILALSSNPVNSSDPVARRVFD